MMIDSYT